MLVLDHLRIKGWWQSFTMLLQSRPLSVDYFHILSDKKEFPLLHRLYYTTYTLVLVQHNYATIWYKKASPDPTNVIKLTSLHITPYLPRLSKQGISRPHPHLLPGNPSPSIHPLKRSTQKEKIMYGIKSTHPLSNTRPHGTRSLKSPLTRHIAHLHRSIRPNPLSLKLLLDRRRLLPPLLPKPRIALFVSLFEV